ncbi:Transferase [Macleaya cordata]|uniref:Transferase n=1 Tax=Macleaya cordata TaxID=56857 RepID=A0A200QZJ9_MACCD|nr:Transferase [Macleaya cordata]
MSYEEVRCVSISAVQPSSHNETTNKRIELNVWDLKTLPYLYMQRGLLFARHKSDEQSKQEETNIIITHLKTSLSYTLNHFFPLAGRLAVEKHDDDTISVYINCNSVGAEFIHAAADITIADILDPVYVPRIVTSLFSLNGVVNYEGRAQPLLSIQVTELIDGIFLGCSMNHTVCDGTSFWHFLNSWSEISRSGTNVILSPPIHERWFLNNTNCPIRLPFSHDELLGKGNTLLRFEVRIFHFKPENIARIKAKANSKSQTNNSISSLQALFAHIWVAVTRARRLDPNEETSFWLVIGNRARLNPPLPEAYFGNSIQFEVATTKAGELLEKGIGLGASLLNQVVMSQDEEAIRNSWDSWAEKPAFLFPDDNVVSPTYTLIAGESPRFNIYGNDFGWGRPIAMRGGLSTMFDGKISSVPGPTEGSIDIELCLSLETLKAMGNDTEFMEAVTVLTPFRSS